MNACREFILQYPMDTLIKHFDLHATIQPSVHETFALTPQLDDCYFPHIPPSIEAIVFNSSRSSTFSAFTSTEFRCLSSTIEIGQKHDFGDNDSNLKWVFFDYFKNAIQDQKTFALNHKRVLRYKIVDEIIRDAEDFVLNPCLEHNNFSHCPRDQWLFRSAGQETHCHDDNSYCLFPNNHVAVGQRAGLIVQRI